MTHTEKCRGCMYENACDYIICRFDEIKNIRNQVIDECINVIMDYFGCNDDNREYHRLLNQMKTE